MSYVVIIEDEPDLVALLAHHFTAEHGIDDFIVRPCGVRDVVARSQAVLRRAGRNRNIGAREEN